MLTLEELQDVIDEMRIPKGGDNMTQKELKELKDKWFDTGKTKDDDSVLENGNKPEDKDKK